MLALRGSDMIVIVDYGIGNLDSVLRGLRHAGAEVVVASAPSALGILG